VKIYRKCSVKLFAYFLRWNIKEMSIFAGLLLIQAAINTHAVELNLARTLSKDDDLVSQQRVKNAEMGLRREIYNRTVTVSHIPTRIYMKKFLYCYNNISLPWDDYVLILEGISD